MSQPEPEDDAARGDAAPGAATFEDIVAGWRAEGAVPDWPDDRATVRAAGPPQPPPDEHFVPPDPPPLPRLGRQAAIAVLLLSVGLLLLVAPEVLGISESVGLPLGLLTLAGGLGWLVLRSWSTDPPDDGGGDDGAVF